MHVLEVRNDDLMDSITRQAAERGITYAAIVALIGAVDSFTVSTTPASDPTAHTYSSYPLPAEMTATGEIVDGKPHIHAVMAIQGDRTIGGHLHRAELGTSFARAYVIPSEHHVAVQENEAIVFAAAPDSPADRDVSTTRESRFSNRSPRRPQEPGGNPRTRTAMLSAARASWQGTKTAPVLPLPLLTRSQRRRRNVD